MAITFTRALRVSYKSSAICLAALRTKKGIIREWRRKIRNEMDGLPPGPPKRRRDEFVKIWTNMATTCNEGIEFFFKGVEGQYSVKKFLEDLWSEHGQTGNPADWPLWAQKTIKTPISFSTDTRNVTVVDNAEDSFTGDSLTDWDFDTHTGTRTAVAIEVFDSITDTLWKAEAMRRWVNNQANRGQASAATLVLWDDLHDKCQQYFDYSMRCLRKIDQQLILRIDDTQATRARADGLITKYDWVQGSNSILARGGLHALDINDLDTLWQGRAQTCPVVYNDAGT